MEKFWYIVVNTHKDGCTYNFYKHIWCSADEAIDYLKALKDFVTKNGYILANSEIEDLTISLDLAGLKIVKK